MVKICQTGLLKSNFETRQKKRIFRFLPKISAGHGWSLKFFFANFQILGPLGCQAWVVIPQNVKKSKNHCTLVYKYTHTFFVYVCKFADYQSVKSLKRVATPFAAGAVFRVTPVYRRYILFRCISTWICSTVCTENRISQSCPTVRVGCLSRVQLPF